MDEKELQEFSLEDIIREFSDKPREEELEPTQEVPAPEEPEEPAEEPEAESAWEEELPWEGMEAPEEVEEVPAPEEPAEEPVEEAVEEAAEEVAAPQIAAELPAEDAQPLTDDTIRLDTAKFTRGQVRNAQPITDEEDAEAPASVSDDTMVFGSDWEPEYEQPIEEYVPAQPILFQPKSRLRELKKKLVNGPERKYYELSEKGLGRLQAAIFFSLLLVLLCAGSTVMYAMGMVPENRLRLMVFGQFFALLISALLGCGQLIEGVADLLKGRFTLNTLLVFTFIGCCADGILGLQEERISCCAAFSLAMTMSLWNAYQRRNTDIGQMDTLRKATNLDAVGVAEEYHTQPGKKDRTVSFKGLLRGDGEVEDFMDHYDSVWKPEKVLSVYALIALLAAVGIGITAGVLGGLSVGVQTYAVTLLAAMPASAFVALSRPMAVLERRLHAVGTVLCGWRGVELLRKKAVFPIRHEDLFPLGCTKMNGMKFFGKRDPDEIVAFAAALVEASGSGLAPLFSQLLVSRNGRYYPVLDVQLHTGGASGTIGGQQVLAGNATFLREMEVEVPEGSRVSGAVYLAIENELCGLFAISYEKNKAANAGIGALCACRGVKPLIVSDDFTLTDSFLRKRFGLPANRVLQPEYGLRSKLRETEFDRQKHPVALLTTKPTLAAFAYGVTGARTLHSACTVGVVIHMLGGILGLGIMLTLTLLGATWLLTPANMFAYQLVWMIPGLLVSEWTRHV